MVTRDNSELYLIAARAYCQHQHTYNGCYVYDDGAEQHLTADAVSTAKEEWLRKVVDAVVDSLIKVAPAAPCGESMPGTYVGVGAMPICINSKNHEGLHYALMKYLQFWNEGFSYTNWNTHVK